MAPQASLHPFESSAVKLYLASQVPERVHHKQYGHLAMNLVGCSHDQAEAELSDADQQLRRAANAQVWM
jgi:hypothetical protein